MRRLILSFLTLAAAMPTAVFGTDVSKLPKQIFAHYMGCYPIGMAALSNQQLNKGQMALKPDGGTYVDRIGGRWRDFPLMPADWTPTLEEAVDLEMRRAMRMGLDGFAVDVLAGQKMALDTIDAMFRVAEEKKYPIQLTFCLDNAKQNPEAVRYLVEKHGKSPNLARRDGKILFLGYRSYVIGQRLHPELTKADWAKPENIRYYGEAVQELEKIAGEPIYVQFDLNGYLDDLPPAQASDPNFWRQAAPEFAKYFGGLSGFFWGGENYNLAAKAARQAGLDWGEPVWVQYQNLAWNTFRLKSGTQLLRDRWEHAIANDATLIQIATWNDYTETTHVAPGWQTGYAINDLMGLMIQRWKTGRMPDATKDRVYLVYSAYPQGSKVYPFHDFAPEIGGTTFEVITHLTKPATVTLPGRNISWEAPAGFSVKELAPTPGPVTAELSRDGQKVLTVTGREPITDRPFRGQHSMVAYSSEDKRLWDEDFPGKPEPSGYYADDNHNGLPNWFEMYYFGKLGDFSTSSGVDAGATAPGGGRTNLQAYLDQTNPFDSNQPPTAGTTWDLLANPIAMTGVSTNPEASSPNTALWRYVYSQPNGGWALLGDGSLSPLRDIERTKATSMSHGDAMKASPLRKVATVSYSNVSKNGLAGDPDQVGGPRVNYQWTRQNEQGTDWNRSLAMMPTSTQRTAVEWTSPADGDYKVQISASASDTRKAAFKLKLTKEDGTALWESPLNANTPQAQTSLEVSLKKNAHLRLEAEASRDQDGAAVNLNHCEITLLK